MRLLALWLALPLAPAPARSVQVVAEQADLSAKRTALQTVDSGAGAPSAPPGPVRRSPSGLLDRLDESERDTDQAPAAGGAPPAAEDGAGAALLRLGLRQAAVQTLDSGAHGAGTVGTPSEPLRRPPSGLLDRLDASEREATRAVIKLGPESSHRVGAATPEFKLGLSGAKRARPGAARSAEDQKLEDILESEGEQEASRKAAHRMALGFLTSLIMVSSVPLLLAYGVKPFAALLAYLVCMMVVKLCVKHTLDSGYPFPFTTTAFQMAMTGLVASCIEQPTVSGARTSLNIAVVKCASLALNNMALVVVTPAAASLLGALLPVTTYGVERLRRRDPTTPPLGIVAACLGAMMLVRGEVSFAPAGVVLVLGSCLCRSLKTVWSHDFMQREFQSPFRLAAWTSIWCLVIMVPVTLVREGKQEPIAAFWGIGFWTKIVFFMGGLLSAGLNILMCYVLRFLGPLPQTVYGQLELVLVLTLSVSWYQEYMGVVQWTGVSLIGLGCVLIRPGASLKGLSRGTSARATEEPAFIAQRDVS